MVSSKPKSSGAAPAKRASPAILNRQIQAALAMTDGDAETTDLVLLLNPERQVVYANEAVLLFLGKKASSLLGGRPGEILHCRNAVKTPGGCGTTQDCKQCLILKAILTAQLEGNASSGKCSLQTEPNGDYVYMTYKTRLRHFDSYDLTELTLRPSVP